jgi:hypothetical protein
MTLLIVKSTVLYFMLFEPCNLCCLHRVFCVVCIVYFMLFTPCILCCLHCVFYVVCTVYFMLFTPCILCWLHRVFYVVSTVQKTASIDECRRKYTTPVHKTAYLKMNPQLRNVEENIN